MSRYDRDRYDFVNNFIQTPFDNLKYFDGKHVLQSVSKFYGKKMYQTHPLWCVKYNFLQGSVRIEHVGRSAIRNDYMRLLKFLISFNAFRKPEYKSLMKLAIRRGHIHVVRFLQHAFNFHKSLQWGFVHEALCSNQLDVLKYVCMFKDQNFLFTKSLLFKACKKHSLKTVEFVFEHLIRDKCFSSDELTIAIARNHFKLVQYILAKSPDLPTNTSMFVDACRNGNLTVLKMLCDMNGKSPFRYHLNAWKSACFRWAAVEGHTHILQFLQNYHKYKVNYWVLKRAPMTTIQFLRNNKEYYHSDSIWHIHKSPPVQVQ